MRKRIRCPKLRKKIISAQDAAALIKDGMNIATGGFTPVGYPKAITLALSERATAGDKLKINLMTGASTGKEMDDALTKAGMIHKRMPYQGTKSTRDALNTVGGIEYQDQHISLFPQQTRYGFFGPIDFAIIEACAITEDGGIIPTTSVGNSPVFVQCAKKVLIELNTAQPLELAGMHDIYLLDDPPHRQPIPLVRSDQRIGTNYIPCPIEKIAGIVITNIPDDADPLADTDELYQKIAENVLTFFEKESKEKNFNLEKLPWQSGVGSVANAVLLGILNSRYSNLHFFSEVIQDAVLDLLESGHFSIASASAITLSPKGLKHFYDNINFFREKIILRPQEISNHPEVIRRLGIISMNTAIEADIYGNINSSHLMGTKMMNGIGGSGDLARNSYLSIFITPSTAKGGAISSFVPMCSHVDHTEHDVSIIISEQGVADLRNKSPRERAMEIINYCAHPDYRPLLTEYYQRALQKTPANWAHTPHVLSEAFSFHQRFLETGSMK
ncbi:MAG: succinate CoA transferase [Bacillota bacterium]|jgi:succinyl-CoA:acetate CoA-transferase